MKYTARRENGESPISGNSINWRWVVRDENGVFIEVEQYSNDLRDRYRSKELTFIGE